MKTAFNPSFQGIFNVKLNGLAKQTEIAVLKLSENGTISDKGFTFSCKPEKDNLISKALEELGVVFSKKEHPHVADETKLDMYF